MAPDNESETATALSFKEEGNGYFRAGQHDLAVKSYTNGLPLATNKEERLVLLKNRAQCLLKLDRFAEAEKDASEALSLDPGDVKALFRRAQALEALGRSVDSYKDVRRLLQIEPSNSAAATMLRRLEAKTKKLVEEQASTSGRVSAMLRVINEKNDDNVQDLVKAVNNLTSLCKEPSSAASYAVIGMNGIQSLVSLCHHSNTDVVCATLRCLSSIAQEDKERSLMILEALSSATIFRLTTVPTPAIVVSAGALLKTILVGLTQIHKFKKERDAYEAERKSRHYQIPPFRRYQMDPDVAEIVDSILKGVTKLTNSYKVSAAGRDSLLQVLIGIVGRQDGIFWAKNFIALNHAIERILEVGAAQVRPGDELKTPEKESDAPGANVANLRVTSDARMHAAVLLNIINDDLTSDQERNKVQEACHAFIIDLLGDDMLDTKVEAMNAISTLLQGPFEVGTSVIGRQGILEGMLLLAQSSVIAHQRAALETIVLSYSKRDKCSGVIQQAVPILRQLYQSPVVEIKVRALVGLCKLGSSGGTDASSRAMADGSSVALSRSCRRLLLDPEAPPETARWAVEGLAYLTLDAEVKEELVGDDAALKRLMQLPQNCTHDVIYPLACVFVNLTNSYDKPEILPEMRELAKFAKQHVPEEDPKDAPEFLKGRIDRLVAAGAQNALYTMSVRSMELPTSGTREQLARVFLALATEERHRGALVQAGAGKALLTLAIDNSSNSENGRALAAQAVAKMGITMDPRLAFPGQRSMEVVRPLVNLLHVDRSALQNFEALMALTNLASVSDKHRERIVKEKGLPAIEHYQFEEHEQLRLAATECLCNLVANEMVQKGFLEDNDRVKLLVLFSAEYDEPGLVRAASGALARLCHIPEICMKITKVTNWFEIIQTLAANPDPQLSHRGSYILCCMMEADRNLAEYLIQTNTLEVLMAVTQLEGDMFQPSRECAQRALDKAVEYGLIQSIASLQTAAKGDSKKKKGKGKEKDKA